MTTFADKITQWKTAIEAKINSMISSHDEDSSAHSSLFSNKSKVTFSRTLSNGTRIGTITIDGTSTDLFCETDTNTTYNTATASANGLMSSEDKVKVNNLITYMSVDDNLNFYIGYDPIESVAVTSNKEVIQSGQEAILTATTKTTNNQLLEGVPIEFYSGNTLLGNGVTNSNGVATYTYTGNGIGEKQFTAKGGKVVSTPYEVLDCIINDSNISDWRNPNSMPISESDGIITVSNSASSNKYLYAQLNSSQTYAHDFVIEMEYYGYTGTAITRVYNGTNADRYISSMGLSNGDILEIKVTSDKVRYYKNGTEISNTAKDYSSDPSYFAMIINNGSISFKNLKIYKI